MHFWDGFAHDPRQAEYGHMRASDSDRDLVREHLAQAYADGRLTREEHDERLTATLSAKTLGELPPIVADLVAPGAVPAHRALTAPLQRVQNRDRHDIWLAVPASATPFVICTAVWLFTSPGGYFWPMWVLFPVLISVLTMLGGGSQRRLPGARGPRRLDGPRSHRDDQD